MSSETVQSSFRTREVDSGVPRTRNRLDSDSEAKPSEFVVDILIDGVQYVYGFGVSSHAVEQEWLHTYPHGRERVIFERTGRKVELGSTLPERRSRAELLASVMRDNALLLSTAVQVDQEEVLPVYRWFTQRLRILGARREWARHPDNFDSPLLEVVKQRPEFVHLLKKADLGISDLRVNKVLVGGVEIGERLQILHGPDQVELALQDQSAGTLAWADLLMSALSALDAGALMVIDEIDVSLHSRLTARLVELFRNIEVNPRGAQLFFTTHDSALLGTSLGEDTLKRDEIWFIEKKDGASTLYPLSDFHPRIGENRERRYLAGSYGAVPVVFPDSFVDALLDTRAEPTDGAA
jgi:uncharacterized protein